MQDTVMTIIAILLAGILLFIFPLMAVAERNNDISQSIAEKAVTDFINEVASTGAITTQSYQKLVNNLASTGNTFDVELEHKQIDENIGKKTQWTNNKVIGENTSISKNTETISEQLQEKGTYNLTAGDTVSAKVKNSNRTIAQTFRSMFDPSGADNKEITAAASAVVTATGNR